MRVASAWSTEAAPEQAAREAWHALLGKLQERPSLLVLHCSAGYDLGAIQAALAEPAAGIPLHGGTSCSGVMTELGLHHQRGRGLGLLGLVDPEGAYGVGACSLAEDPEAAAQAAAQQALAQADRLGEIPTMLWITCAPGSEERVIEGLGKLFGPHVPIGGGSSADDDISGGWQQLANDRTYRDAVVVTTMFASRGVAFAFHSGYDPTPTSATVTRASRRQVQELDGRPAAQVYARWLDGGLREILQRGGTILRESTMAPLGKRVGATPSAAYYQLAHPSQIGPDHSLSLFCDVAEGDTLVLMHGTTTSLVERAERVARSALRSAEHDHAKVAGALVVYCAGCMLAVRDQLDRVVEHLRLGLGPEVPFLGTFTFGEQGCFPNGENRHGNLMISVLVFLA